MILFLLIIFGSIGLVYLLYWALTDYCVYRIGKTSTAKDSVKVRRTFRIIKIAFIICYTAMLIPLATFCIEFLTTNLSTSGGRYNVLVPIVTLLLYPYAFMSLPVSALTLDKIKDEEFAIFLRGFSSDDYEKSQMEKLEDAHRRAKFLRTKRVDPSTQPFSERSFYKAIKKMMPIYAVGMTKELESPEGCKRIYLDDETWQRDVGNLIERAQYVFVLLHDSESCIWEIQQCDSFLNKNKTVYFIDCFDNLTSISAKMGYKFPECLNNCFYVDHAEKHIVAYNIKNTNVIQKYQNDTEGFKQFLDRYLFEKRSTTKTLEPKPTMPMSNGIKSLAQDVTVTHQPSDHTRFMPH